jgi:hypothetical protein
MCILCNLRYPPNDIVMPDMLERLSEFAGCEVTTESWNKDVDGNWHFYLNGVEQSDPDGSKAETAEWLLNPAWLREITPD